MQQQPLERPQRSLADQLVAPDHEAPGRPEPHVGGRRVGIADDLDLPRIRHPEPAFVTHPEIWDRERIEAHDLRRDRVDRHLVRRRQDQVAHARDHRARPRAVPHHRAVHHRQERWMQLALHVHEVDQDFVHELVGVVANFLQEPPEAVLDRARGDAVAMNLDRRSVKNVLADVHLRDLDALGEDVVELQERRLEPVGDPLDLGQRDERQTEPLEDRRPLVVAGAPDRVRHHRLVLDRIELPLVVTVLEQRSDDPLDLPGLARARREVLGPGKVELEDQILVAPENLVVLDEPHEPAVVGHDRPGACPQHRDLGRHAQSSALMG